MSQFRLPSTICELYKHHKNDDLYAIVVSSDEPHDISVSINKKDNTINLPMRTRNKSNSSIFDLSSKVPIGSDDEDNSEHSEQSEQSEHSEHSEQSEDDSLRDGVTYSVISRYWENGYQYDLILSKWYSLSIHKTDGRLNSSTKDSFLNSLKFHDIQRFSLYKVTDDIDMEIIDYLSIKTLGFYSEDCDLLDLLDLNHMETIEFSDIDKLLLSYHKFDKYPKLRKVKLYTFNKECLCQDNLSILDSLLDSGITIVIGDLTLSKSQLYVSAKYRVVKSLTYETKAPFLELLEYYKTSVNLVYTERVEGHDFSSDLKLILNNKLNFRVTKITITDTYTDTVTITLNNKVEELNLEKRTKLTKSARSFSNNFSIK